MPIQKSVSPCRFETIDWRASSSIIIRLAAIRKLAVEAADNGLLAPGLAVGITRVKGVKGKGVRAGNWLLLRKRRRCSAPQISKQRRGCGTVRYLRS